MTRLIAMLALAMAILPTLGGCNEDEKKQGKDAIREFVEEEKQKEQERTNYLWRDYGESGHMPTDPFADTQSNQGPKTQPQKPPQPPKQ